MPGAEPASRRESAHGRRAKWAGCRTLGVPDICDRYVTWVTAKARRAVQDCPAMHCLETCQKVRLNGRIGVFFVLSIDGDMGTAELLPLDRLAPLLPAVPFADIQPYMQLEPLETC